LLGKGSGYAKRNL